MQYRVPVRVLYEIRLQLAKYLRRKHEHEDDDLERGGDVYVQLVLHELRQQVDHQHQHADESALNVAAEYAADEDKYDDEAQDDIGPERRRFLLSLAEQGFTLVLPALRELFHHFASPFCFSWTSARSRTPRCTPSLCPDISEPVHWSGPGLCRAGCRAPSSAISL